MISIKKRGTPNTSDYRIYFCNKNGPISPLHDIPLWADRETFNMIVEMPRWTNAKMEISMTETLNPIKQEASGGKLRYVKNCFPYHGIMWNYGSLPQTWEDVEAVDEMTKFKGDGEPLDIIEIGQYIPKSGEVIQVKILGILAVIDRKKTDWKVIGINVNDELANSFNEIDDVHKKFPQILSATKEWLRVYKTLDGKPENEFAFNGETKGRQFTLNIIDKVHHQWQQLIKNTKKVEEISCSNVTISTSPFKITLADAQEIVKQSPILGLPQPMNPTIDKWYFI